MDLFLGLIFGGVGTGYLIYAKRNREATFAITGVLLIIYPYIFTGALMIFVVGALLTAAPFVLERYFEG
jgi:hypothetical protein